MDRHRTWSDPLRLEGTRFMITDGSRTCHAFAGLVHRDHDPLRWRLGIRARAPTLLGMIVLVGCAQTNHYLIHPREAAPEVIVWSVDFARDELKVHIEGARPPGIGPFPTVIVLPEVEATASDMHGAIWD